jgi:multicomponent Na+:H+ antiporter subunit E
MDAPDPSRREPASTPAHGQLVLPVEDVPGMRDAVEHAAGAVRSADGTLHLVAGDTAGAETAAAILARAEGWVRSLDPDDEDPDVVVTEVLEVPHETAQAYAAAIAEYADAQGVDDVLLAPSVDLPGGDIVLEELRAALTGHGLTVDRAPEPRRAYHRGLVGPGSLPRLVALFAASYLFYLLLGGFTTFNLVTGALVAGLVATLLHRVSIPAAPRVGRTGARALRGFAYGPYLLFEIVKANLQIARVILDPRLPIDPDLRRYRCSLESDLARTLLANSITLTPGTLSVDVTGDVFTVHRLITPAGAERLARAVAFVFHGREGLERVRWELIEEGAP